MTTKEYLSQVSSLERRIRTQKDEIDMLRELSVSVSIRYDGERVQTSGCHDSLASAVIHIQEEEDKLADMIKKYLEVKEIIKNQIFRMDNPLYSDLLFEKYVVGLSFIKMQETMNYSRRQLIRLHGVALLEFEKKYKYSFKEFLMEQCEENRET